MANQIYRPDPSKAQFPCVKTNTATITPVHVSALSMFSCILSILRNERTEQLCLWGVVQYTEMLNLAATVMLRFWTKPGSKMSLKMRSSQNLLERKLQEQLISSFGFSIVTSLFLIEPEETRPLSHPLSVILRVKQFTVRPPGLCKVMVRKYFV